MSVGAGISTLTLTPSNMDVDPPGVQIEPDPVANGGLPPAGPAPTIRAIFVPVFATLSRVDIDIDAAASTPGDGFVLYLRNSCGCCEAIAIQIIP